MRTGKIHWEKGDKERGAEWERERGAEIQMMRMGKIQMGRGLNIER